MWHRGCNARFFGACSILVLAICPTAVEAQVMDARKYDAAPEKPAVSPELVNLQEMTKVLEQVERVLQQVQRRAAGDRTLKQLADAPVHRNDYANGKGESKGCRLMLGAPTEDRIEIPTTGAPVKVQGNVGVVIEYLGDGSTGSTVSGLYGGGATWKTNNPHVFVSCGWFTRDLDVPDRLLEIVREELEREGLRLIPMQKLDWPAATTSERLSQLLPPDPARRANTQSRVVIASPQSPLKVFATPTDVVAAHNRAVANKDWEAYARCLTPASQGAEIGEVLFLAGMGGKKCPVKWTPMSRPLGPVFKLWSGTSPFLVG